MIHIEEQIKRARRIGRTLKPKSFHDFATILIPSITEYDEDQRFQTNFDHYDIITMWNKIMPDNGASVKNWERVFQVLILFHL